LASYTVLESESTTKDKKGIWDGQSGTTSSFALRELRYSPTDLNSCFKTMVPQDNLEGSAV